MKLPPYGRRESMELVALLLSRMEPGSFMIELGSTRARGGWHGDGYSTPYFGFHAIQNFHFFYSVDIDPRVTEIAKAICAEYGIVHDKMVNHVTMDGIEFLKMWAKTGTRVDFLYLDAWDYVPGHEKESGERHLEAFQAIEKSLSPGSIVLIDDIHDTVKFTGKGELLLPYMLANGWGFIYMGYQCLLTQNKPGVKDAEQHDAGADGGSVGEGSGGVQP